MARWKKRRRKEDLSKLEGVITFFGSHYALRAEKVLKNNGFNAILIPGPRAISPNCGVALRFAFEASDQIQSILESNFVTYEAIHHYPH
jgi:hypothetical protein